MKKREDRAALRTGAIGGRCASVVAAILVSGSGTYAAQAQLPTAVAAPDASADIVAALPANDFTPIAGSQSSANVVTPDSAFKCDTAGTTCIDVEGSSLTVNKLEALYTGNVGCARASFTRNATVFYTGKTICPDTTEVGIYTNSYPNVPKKFKNNDRLCIYWTKTSTNTIIDPFSYPCATIKK